MDAIALRIAARFQREAHPSNQGKFLGRDCRLTWGRHSWVLEELPIKGKKKLKVFELQNPASHGGHGLDPYIDGNILRDANLSSSDTYETIKHKLLDAYAIAAEASLKQVKPEHVKNYQWLRDLKGREEEVYFLKVTPENTEPFKVEGKDFTLSVSWTDFSVYSPQSDFQQTQPFYTGYKAKSPAAARRLYQILKANPTALASKSYDQLDAWFNQNKIATRSDHSVWT